MVWQTRNGRALSMVQGSGPWQEIRCPGSTLCLLLLLFKMASISQPDSKRTYHIIQKELSTGEQRGGQGSSKRWCV